jgi:hypothetical protein
MPPTTETDLKELRDLMTANHAAVTQQVAALSQQMVALSQRVEVGFAQVDIKFDQVDTKLAQVDTKISDLRGEVNTRLAEMKGDLKIVKQPIKSWDFVKRLVVVGFVVTIAGGLLLAEWKIAIFGTI